MTEYRRCRVSRVPLRLSRIKLEPFLSRKLVIANFLQKCLLHLSFESEDLQQLENVRNDDDDGLERETMR